MQNFKKEDFIYCKICGKKLFKVKSGAGVIEMKCRGCRQEVTVPFGKLPDKDGNINK